MKTINRLKTKLASEIKDAFNDYRNRELLSKLADDCRFEITYDFGGDDIDLVGMRKVNYKIIGTDNYCYKSLYNKTIIRTESLHLWF